MKPGWTRTLLALAIGGFANHVDGQADFIRFDALVSARIALEDFPPFNPGPLSPALRTEIREPDELETAFNDWADLDSLENEVVQWLLADGMRRYQELALLSDGHCAPLFPALEARDLPRSLGYLPLLLTACDPSYVGPSNRKGIWGLVDDAEGSTVEWLHVPEIATEMAIAQLEKAWAKHPDDPMVALWTFLHQGRHPLGTRPPAPGAAPSFDEWITLYRVTARLLENFKRPNRREIWLDWWATWEPVDCPGPLTAQAIRANLGWNRRVQQTFMPWFETGEVTCADWMELDWMLPPKRAQAWANQMHSSPPVPPTFPTTIHRVLSGESLGGIARMYGVDLQEIIVRNGLSTSALQADQILEIPNLP